MNLFEILRGLWTTLRSAFEAPVTYQYPEVKRPVRERFKGRHELKRFDNGLEKCIGLRYARQHVLLMQFLLKPPRMQMINVSRPVNAMPARMRSICCAAFFVGIAKTPVLLRRSY